MQTVQQLVTTGSQEKSLGKQEQNHSISCNCDEAVIFVVQLLESRQYI